MMSDAYAVLLREEGARWRAALLVNGIEAAVTTGRSREQAVGELLRESASLQGQLLLDRDQITVTVQSDDLPAEWPSSHE